MTHTEKLRLAELEKRVAALEAFIVRGSRIWDEEKAAQMIYEDSLCDVVRDTVANDCSVTASFEVEGH